MKRLTTNVGTIITNGAIFITANIKMPLHFSDRRLVSSKIFLDEVWRIPEKSQRLRIYWNCDLFNSLLLMTHPKRCMNLYNSSLFQIKSRKFVDDVSRAEPTYALSMYSLKLFASFLKKKQFDTNAKPSKKNIPNVFAFSFRADGLGSMPNNFKFRWTIWKVFIAINGNEILDTNNKMTAMFYRETSIRRHVFMCTSVC